MGWNGQDAGDVGREARMPAAGSSAQRELRAVHRAAGGSAGVSLWIPTCPYNLLVGSVVSLQGKNCPSIRT